MPPELDVLATCVLIVLARIADVSLGTIRTVSVINGHRGASWLLGFFEVLIWVLIVSKVIGEVQENPVYAGAYALGFATGNFIGITIETRLAFGEQVVRVFTRRGREVAEALRRAEYGVTIFEGHGRDGPVEMLFVETRRRRARDVSTIARRIDPKCFLVIDDVRTSSTAWGTQQSGGWRSVLKRK